MTSSDLLNPTAKNVLLTGPPGCGKTTGVLRLVELMKGVRPAGFHTCELREQGQRVGFEAVGLSSGLQATLAHVRSQSRLRVGRYGVEPESLEPLVEAELMKPFSEVDAFVVDEIGKMELYCPAFVEAIPRLLDGPTPVIATVALKGGGLIEKVKARSDVRVLPVGTENRDGLPVILESWLRSRDRLA